MPLTVLQGRIGLSSPKNHPKMDVSCISFLYRKKSFIIAVSF